jgi:hypothetical protein
MKKIMVFLSLFCIAACATSTQSSSLHADGADINSRHPTSGELSSMNTSPNSSPLQRNYNVGEVLSYRIVMAHEMDGKISSSYDAHATGTVKQNANGTYYEEFLWTKLFEDGAEVNLSKESHDLRQTLSLAPGFKLSIPPELPKIDASLIGPVTDLLTFYVDDSLAIRQPTIRRAGDHIFLKTSIASSWGAGQDCIDFDVTLLAIDKIQNTATLKVSHVPPSTICIQPPADWMKNQVMDTPNNWFEIESHADKWIASAGKEAFDVELNVDLVSGIIHSATMTNPVDFESRECGDKDLKNCSGPVKHRIVRQLKLTLEPK